jgi:hypothetical protein
MKKLILAALLTLSVAAHAQNPTQKYCGVITDIAGDVYDAKLQGISQDNLTEFYKGELNKRRVSQQIKNDVLALIVIAYDDQYQSKNDYTFKVYRICIGD